MEVAVPEARHAGELCRAGRLRPQKWIAQRRLHPCPCHSSRFTGGSEGGLAMGAWPDLTEYHEAVQHPQKAFADPGLKAVTLELDRFGMPKPATGGNAVVYKAKEPGGFLSFKKTWAIRCFLRPISDHAERYEAISKHLGKVHLPYDVNFRFLKQGIQIRSSWFPIVKMQWADGDLLHSHIEKHLRYPAALAALRAKWVTLVRHIEAAQVAHDDFQQLGRSPIWQQLRLVASREIDQLAAALAAMVQQHPMKVGNLDSVLKNLTSFQFPTSIPASTPAQRVAPKPARVPTPPVPSWMKKSGYRDHSDD